MNNYLLSIIIPTRNRQKYCKAAVEQILQHCWDNVQICVQDNSEDDSLRGWIDSLQNNNVVYNYHPGTLSFVDNFSEAVSLAQGEYLCMIGDDDGILSTIFRLIEEMKLHNADAAIPSLSFIYFWPSKQNIIKNSEKGVCLAHLYSEQPGRCTRVINGGEKGIAQLLQNGIQDYYNHDIPRLYHGVVKRYILEKIKTTTGHYFGGLTPDMYMAISLSLTCKKIVRVNYSVTISGICSTSGSSDSATGKHTGKLIDAPHFRGHDEYEWDKMIPSFYSVDTIWGDTLLHALKEFGRIDLIKEFNFALFSGLCINKYPEYGNLILQHAKANGCSLIKIKLSLVKYNIKVLYKRIKGKFSRYFNCQGLSNKNEIIECVPNIQSAEKAIMKLYDKYQ